MYVTMLRNNIHTSIFLRYLFSLDEKFRMFQITKYDFTKNVVRFRSLILVKIRHEETHPRSGGCV